MVKTVVGTSEEMFHTVSRDTWEGENQVVEPVGMLGGLIVRNVGAKTVSGKSEEMFNVVHRDTCKDEGRIGRETPVVRKTAVWDTCSGGGS